MYLAKLKGYLPILLLLIAVFVFVQYLYDNADRYRELLDLSLFSVVLLILLVIVSLVASGIINYFIFRVLGIPLTVHEGIGLASLHTLANQITFAGGAITKGVYLKQHHKLSYTNYISATFALYVLFLTVNGTMGIVSLVYLTLLQETAASSLLFVGFLVMTSCAIVFLLPADFNLPFPKWNQRIGQLLKGWQVLRENKFVLWQLIVVQVLIIMIGAGRFWVAFNMLSQNATLAECILFSSATILTHLVAVTPGGLGIREAIVAGVASIFHFDLGVSLAAVTIDRLVSTLVIVGMGVAYTYILGKKLQIDPS